MSIRKLRARADELSRDALLERRRCKASLESALAIVRRRVGSQAGLAISFSLGFIAGTPRSRKSGRRRPRRSSAREQLTGTVIGSAARLLVPIFTNALVLASRNTAGAAAGGGHQPSRSSPPTSADATADAA